MLVMKVEGTERTEKNIARVLVGRPAWTLEEVDNWLWLKTTQGPSKRYDYES
jgi:hypothetical protein